MKHDENANCSPLCPYCYHLNKISKLGVYKTAQTKPEVHKGV